MQDETGEMLAGRVHLDIEGLELVEVLMIEILHHATRCRLELLDVNQHADLIELFAAHVDFYLPVVAVHVFALAAVAPRRVGG